MRASTSVSVVFLASVLLTGLGACSLIVGDITPEEGAGGSGNAGGSGGAGTGAGGAGGTGGAGGAGGAGGGSAACVPEAVVCEDQVLQQMNLLNDQVTPGLITNEADGAGWRSMIDATAGGPFASTPDSYTYGRFTDAGLEKVDIADDASLDSTAWDIAFRRYVIRINSGNSGPSCVTATPIPGDPPYDDVSTVPEPLPEYRRDEYFDAGCQLIPDGQGLQGSPATALAGYYSYQSCVSMTDRVYIVRLADGRRLKLTVTDYYSPDVQEQCDATGSIPMMNTGSANFRVRWAFLP